MHLKELATEYLETDFHERSLKTIEGNKIYVGHFVKFIGNREINLDTYRAWVNYCYGRWSAKTCQEAAVGFIKRFLNWLELHGHIEKNPHRFIKIPALKINPPKEPITPEEFELLKSVVLDYPAMLWVLVCGWNTGMSMGDVCLLQWSCVDLNNNIIAINRLITGMRCLIPLRPDGECVTMLHGKVSEKSIDWPNNPMKGISYVDTELAGIYSRGESYMQHRIIRLFRKAGIKKGKSFNNLRVAYCLRLAKAGVSFALACKMTGHKDRSVFAHYVTPDLSLLHDQSNLAWDSQEESNPRSLPSPS